MLICLSFAGMGLGLAIAQQIADDGSSGSVGVALEEDIEVGHPPPPDDPATDPGTDAIKPVTQKGASKASGGSSKASGGSSKSRVVPPAARSVIRPPAGKPVVMPPHPMYARFEAETQRRMATYLGTRIDPLYPPKPGQEELTQEIAAAFAKLDPKVQERVARFAWVDKYPDANPMGWRGRISNLERVAGGWLVEIQVAPAFSPRAGQMVTTDKCVERWLYSNGTLQQVPNPHAHSPLDAGLIVD